MSTLTLIRPLALRAKLLLFFFAMIAIGAATVSAHRWLRTSVAETSLPAAQLLPAAQPSREDPKVDEVILLTIRPTGFEPAEATLPAGKYLLVVQNRSGLKELDLRLDMASKGKLLEISNPKSKLDWRRQLNLAPGTYTLTEANNPEWVCRVTITP